jgi:uncharacterized membrane protein SpoIIM required for sporulation
MEYSRFVRLRRPQWDSFERHLEEARQGARVIHHRDLEELSLSYLQILHDHAHAASRYPGTGAARLLHRLALEGTHWLQWDRLDRVPGPGLFFRETFPRAIRRQLPLIGLAFALFAVAFAFGLTLGTAQPRAGLTLLGPQAVAGLKEGRLWTESLVTTVPPTVSSSAIATNNMAVALTGWAGGALAGLGSLYTILLNGFLLGVIFAATSHYSLAGKLLEFTAAHGPLEITLILFTAAGGLNLGRALVAAEDRPRSKVLTEASRDALVLLVGCIPWFVVLGLVEGFISPSLGVPIPLKIGLGAALESLFLVSALNPLLKE